MGGGGCPAQKKNKTSWWAQLDVLYYSCVLPWKQRYALQELHIQQLISTGESGFEQETFSLSLLPSHLHRFHCVLNWTGGWCLNKRSFCSLNVITVKVIHRDQHGGKAKSRRDRVWCSYTICSFRGREMAQHSTSFILTNLKLADIYYSCNLWIIFEALMCRDD